MAKHFFLSIFQDTYRCFDKKRAKSQENYVTKLIIGLTLQIEKKRDKIMPLGFAEIHVLLVTSPLNSIYMVMVLSKMQVQSIIYNNDKKK